jgi:anti-sigma B factor antagonist
MSALNVERISGVCVARPSEDIDASNARRVSDALVACLDEGSDDLVLDLSDSRYVDSAGIDMLFHLHELLRDRRGRLLLVIPAQSNLARLAEIVALPSAVPVYDTLQRALTDTQRTLT